MCASLITCQSKRKSEGQTGGLGDPKGSKSERRTQMNGKDRAESGVASKANYLQLNESISISRDKGGSPLVLVLPISL